MTVTWIRVGEHWHLSTLLKLEQEGVGGGGKD